MTTPLSPSQLFNDEQLARWNGPEGEYWAAQYVRLDHILAPVIGYLSDFAKPSRGSIVVDVGCGCGATTMEFAQLVGPTGRVIGIDISEPMLMRARERLADFSYVSFDLGDAATLPLHTIGADLIISRFGVMFFGDAIAAFTNLHTALRPGGRLRFACWRPIHENPWLQIPLHATYEYVPRLPKPQPEERGPFSFADPERVTRILTEAGFMVPSFTPLDVEIDLSAGGLFEDAVLQSADMGPAKRALADQPEEVRAAAIQSIRRALMPYATSEGVRLPGAVWLVAADRAD